MFIDAPFTREEYGEESAVRGKAAFKAIREEIGATQDEFAEKLGVAVRTIKRWESPDFHEPPDDAWDLLEDEANRYKKSTKDLSERFSLIADRFKQETLYVPYYRVPDNGCPPAGAVGMSNAQLRAAARDASCNVLFVYEDEIEKTKSYWMTKIALDIQLYGSEAPCLLCWDDECDDDIEQTPRYDRVRYTSNLKEESSLIDLWDTVKTLTMSEAWQLLKKSVEPRPVDEETLRLMIRAKSSKSAIDIARERLLLKSEEEQTSKRAKDIQFLLDRAHAVALSNTYQSPSEDLHTLDLLEMYSLDVNENDWLVYDKNIPDYDQKDLELMSLDIDPGEFGWLPDEDKILALSETSLGLQDYYDYLDDSSWSDEMIRYVIDGNSVETLLSLPDEMKYEEICSHGYYPSDFADLFDDCAYALDDYEEDNV